MTYTHRHLVEIAFNDQAETDTDRKQLLLQSHCDLYKRGVVYLELKPTMCGVNLGKACISQFHRCIGACNTYKQKCSFCEQQALQCLSS